MRLQEQAQNLLDRLSLSEKFHRTFSLKAEDLAALGSRLAAAETTGPPATPDEEPGP